jgi:uncharacterized protein (TIGR02246 family)
MSVDYASLVTDDVAAVTALPGRIAAAWADYDADAFAETFTEDGTLILPNGIYLTNREEIRSYMKKGFAGPYRGTQVTGTPLAVNVLGDGAAVMNTYGGVIAPGATELAADAAVRATWVVTRKEGEWLIAAYQNTPVGTAG